MYMGCSALSSNITQVRRDAGHVSGSPRDVAFQSCARINAPISPPPSRKGGIGRLRGISLSGRRAAIPHPAAMSGAFIVATMRAVGWLSYNTPRRITEGLDRCCKDAYLFGVGIARKRKAALTPLRRMHSRGA